MGTAILGITVSFKSKLTIQALGFVPVLIRHDCLFGQIQAFVIVILKVKL